ncbi:DMT family transporter [Deinococcus fonticola]|uniref:DMT family transporter n=1 Tax=Deinococcus fonticola TaxID=2528713 RepID=UPI001074BB8F|nr:DMT family transporter [Deinococcus fonticola]
MTGVWLGLGAALSWGFADYLAQPATRRLGTVRAAFYAQLIGLVLLFPLVLLTQPVIFPAGAENWLWIVVTGLLGGAGNLAFYRAAKLGNLAVVAPIMGSYGAVTTLLAWGWGEHLSARVTLGLLLALGSVVLVSIPARQARARALPRQVQGLLWALVSAVVVGTCFFVMGHELTPRIGGTLTTWWTRVVGLSLNLLILLFTRQATSLGKVPATSLLAPGLSGILSMSAVLLTALGLGRGEDAVVTVLGSMSIVITTILALFIVRERLTGVQWVGVTLALLSVLLIGWK